VSQAASQAWAFYREVAAKRLLWTIRDDTGFPAPQNSGGKRVMPFWSSKSRVERIIKTVPAYSGFEPHEVAWADFCSTWAPDLVKDDMLVGVNWSGARALGYDIEPMNVIRSVQTLIEEPR